MLACNLIASIVEGEGGARQRLWRGRASFQLAATTSQLLSFSVAPSPSDLSQGPELLPNGRKKKLLRPT